MTVSSHILVKFDIKHILPIFLIKFINMLAKTIRYKESLNINFSKTILAQISLICFFSLQ